MLDSYTPAENVHMYSLREAVTTNMHLPVVRPVGPAGSSLSNSKVGTTPAEGTPSLMRTLAHINSWAQPLRRRTLRPQPQLRPTETAVSGEKKRSLVRPSLVVPRPVLVPSLLSPLCQHKHQPCHATRSRSSAFILVSSDLGRASPGLFLPRAAFGMEQWQVGPVPDYVYANSPHNANDLQ
jgi:hypothetical protein